MVYNNQDTIFLQAKFHSKHKAFTLVKLYRSHHTEKSHERLQKLPGPRLNIKTVLSTYGDFHVKDKTAVRTSYL